MLLFCSLVSFIWAMAFTTGVQALVNGLLVTLLGFALPSGFVFWVAWAIDRTEVPHEEGAGEGHRRASATFVDRPLWLRYGFAVAASALATALRWLIDPVLGNTLPYPTFFLAVAAAAWYGGLGPGIVATLLSGAAAAVFFIEPRLITEVARAADIAGLGIYVAVSTGIAAMTAGLRASQRRAQALLEQVHLRQAALEESEGRFRAVADEVPAIIWMTDAQHACVYVNRGTVEFLGRPVLQLLGDGWSASVHPEDVLRVREAIQKAFEAREPFAVDFRLKRHDDTYRVVRDEGRPRFDSDGHFLGFIGVSVDITDRVTAPATVAG